VHMSTDAYASSALLIIALFAMPCAFKKFEISAGYHFAIPFIALVVAHLYVMKFHVVGAVQVESSLTHSLKAPGFNP
jgi:hypothetical protein